MRRDLAGMRWGPARCQIGRRRKGAKAQGREATRQKPGVGQLTEANCDVDALLDDVHEVIVQADVDNDLRVTGSEHRQRRGDKMQTDRERRRDAEGPRRLGASCGRDLFDLLCVP